ncbi:MAG: L-fucose isomerase [Spirochaetales bacterium]|nr:L-fucose isomerase [Spirochaetales bacterium]
MSKIGRVMPAERRYGNHLPKIGIRPIIDGRRRGIREALEDRTMRMAKQAADLYSRHLRHPNGEAVECVIADSCIGGVAEAAACEEKFHNLGVGVSLSVTPCWCYGSETMDVDPWRPKAVWGINSTEYPGAVYLAAVLAAHAQKGLPAFGIYGRDVQDAADESIPGDVQEKLLRFARAGLAAAWMRGKAYLSIGSVSMGIAGSIVQESFFQDYLGMRNEYADMCEISRRIEEGIFDTDEYERAREWVKANCHEGRDNNPPEMQLSREKKDAVWDYVIKMTMIGRDLMVGNPKLAELGYGEEAMGHYALAAGFQGQRQWTDYLPNGDFMEAILNTSFDWNGIRQPFLMATENDSLNGACMLFGHLLTGTSQMFSDVRTFWSADAVERATGYRPQGRASGGFIHLINSGPTALDATGEQSDSDGNPVIKPFWEITSDEAEKCLKATLWRPAEQQYFRGGGFSSDFLSRGEMPVTMFRINLVKGLGPILQIAQGYTVELPAEVHQALDERTNPTWPTTWFVPELTGTGPFTDVYSVMSSWGANHGAISYGHIGPDLITLAAVLRIPVSTHNVDEKDIFRPAVWNAFGMDTEGADFRACANFGSLYG